MKIHILIILSCCALICFQWGGLHYYKENLKSESRLFKDFQNKYNDATQTHDESRKDALVEILLRHQPDREQLSIEMGNYFLFGPVIFGLEIIGLILVIIRQKRLTPS